MTAQTLTLNDYIQEAINGHQTATRFLHFRTDRLPYQRAQHVAHAIGQYNDYNPKAVGRAIVAIQAACEEDILYEVGRELSPVLYVHVCSKESRDRAWTLLKDTNPDELHLENEYSHGGRYTATIRAWWD